VASRARIVTEAVGVFNLDWAQIGSVVATGTVLSILTSIAGDRATNNGPAFIHARGIGVENTEPKEALRHQYADGIIDTPSAMLFEPDASEGDSEDEDENYAGDFEDDPDEPRR